MADKEDDWTWPTRPRSADEFDAMMKSVDQHLAACGKLPHQRDMNAQLLVARAFGLPWSFPQRGKRGEPFSDADLLPRVFDWFDAYLGERNKVNASPGNVVVQLHGTLW